VCPGPPRARRLWAEDGTGGRRAGFAAYEHDDLRGAEKLFQRGHRLAARLGDRESEVWLAVYAADLAMVRGDFARAQDYYERSVIYRDRDVPTRPGGRPLRIDNNLAVAHARQGHQAEAQRLLEEAVSTWRTMPYSPAYPAGMHMLLLGNLARVYRAQAWSPSAEAMAREVDAKLSLMEQANRLVRAPVGEADEAPRALREFAALLRDAHRPEEAERFEEHLRWGSHDGDYFWRCQDWSSRRRSTKALDDCFFAIP
jgi:tetratricopeptide (TPR) repeat protein